MAYTSADIQAWMDQNKGLTPNQLASVAAQYGVTANQLDTAMNGINYGGNTWNNQATNWVNQVNTATPGYTQSQFQTDFGVTTPQNTNLSSANQYAQQKVTDFKNANPYATEEQIAAEAARYGGTYSNGTVDYGRGVTASINPATTSVPKQTVTPPNDNTVTTAPWEKAQPYLLDAFNRANALSMAPGVSQNMNSAFQGMQGAIQNSPLTGQASNVISNTLSRDPANAYGINQRNAYEGQTTPNAQLSQSQAPGTNPYAGQDNPYLNSVINASQQDAYRAMNPMFQAQQRASGAYGNTGLSEAQTRQMTQTMGNISNQARMADYGTQQQLAESNIARNLQNSQFNANNANQNAQFNSGLAASDLTRNASLNQNMLQNNLNQYNTATNNQNNAAFNTPQFNQSNAQGYGSLFNAASQMNNAQWQPLQNYTNIITGSGGGQQTAPQNNYSNNWLTGLGALGVGSSIYSNIFK